MTAAAADARVLTPSEVVYFHAPRFARAKALLDAADLIHTDEKVRATDLAQAAVTAAFLAAEREGALRLSVEKQSKLFGLRKVDAVLAEATGAAPFPPGTFEARILQLAKAKRDARAIVIDLLREDAPAPFQWTLQLVVEALANRGIVARGERRVMKVMRVATYDMTPEAERLVADTPPDAVRALLDAAEKERPQLYELLQDAIKSGIKFRQESSDSGPD